MSDVRTFKVGDRVVIHPDAVETFLMPVRRLAQQGRMATVTQVPNSDSRHGRRYYEIEFDVKKSGAKGHRVNVSWGDLLLAAAQKT